MDLKPVVAKRIKLARVELDMSQADLAEALEVSPTAVTKRESGKISMGIDTLGRIADTLHKPITYFFQPFEQVPDRPKSRPKAHAGRVG